MARFIKSLFISIFPVLGLIIGGYSTALLLEYEFQLNTFGNALSGLTVAAFFLGLFIVSQPRTSALLLPYSLPIAIGTFLGLWNTELNYLTFGSSISLALGWALYLFWYSKFEARESPSLGLNKKIPNFQLESTAGEKIDNTQFLGNPTIYMFYRGNWCPLCMAQIKEIAQQYRELQARGAQMVFISPQPHTYTEKLAAKFDLGFHYLQDTQNAVAKKLGILSEAGIPLGFQTMGYSSDTVMPTVIITDSEGIIRFADLTDNYRVRPEPETFLNVIDAMR